MKQGFLKIVVGFLCSLLIGSAQAGLFSSTESDLQEAINGMYKQGDLSPHYMAHPFDKTPYVYLKNLDAAAESLKESVPIKGMIEAGILEVEHMKVSVPIEELRKHGFWGNGGLFPNETIGLIKLSVTDKGRKLIAPYKGLNAFKFPGAKAHLEEFTEPASGKGGITTTVRLRDDLSGLAPEYRQMLLERDPNYETEQWPLELVKTNKGWRESDDSIRESKFFKQKNLRNYQKAIWTIR